MRSLSYVNKRQDVKKFYSKVNKHACCVAYDENAPRNQQSYKTSGLHPYRGVLPLKKHVMVEHAKAHAHVCAPLVTSSLLAHDMHEPSLYATRDSKPFVAHCMLNQVDLYPAHHADIKSLGVQRT